jgi:hypothetical protein
MWQLAHRRKDEYGYTSAEFQSIFERLWLREFVELSIAQADELRWNLSRKEWVAIKRRAREILEENGIL